MNIHFLHGTETGNSEMLCEDLEADLGAGFECSISSLADIKPDELVKDTLYIFVVSTYGSGDVPATAQAFSGALETRPDLSPVRFAIFGLGDMVFAETFAQGSKTLMEQLIASGAAMVGERGVHDASGGDMPEDVALPWFRDILEKLPETAT
ncbi:MAG: flavodoxin domain-containing protein [Rhodobacteraceae bacterium]|nr:flavodoxin domain-containing protein [Paracoccaceae bacterium]